MSTGLIETVTYEEFCNKFNLNFNVLVVDCEGCFCDVYESMEEQINNFDKILIEFDQPHLCDYENIKKN